MSTTTININVQGLNMTNIQPNSITEVCINGLTFYGVDILFGSVTTIGDLNIYLVCPSGNRILLVPSGVTTSNSIADGYTNTCFTTTATNNIANGTPPYYTGDFMPNQALSNLNGCTANGLWSMEVQSNTLFGFGVGTFWGWSITFDDPEISYTPDFTWSPTNTLTNANTLNPTACPTSTQTYTLTATDSAGCASASDMVTVTVDPACCPLSFTSSVTYPTCNGSGAIAVNITAGSGNYGYNWSHNVALNSPNASNLSPGTYSVTVNDITNACQRDTTIVLPSPQGCCTLAFTSNVTHTTCNYPNGAIDINVTSGSGNYSYNWSNGLTTQDAPNLPAGTYSVTITDNTQGCQRDTTVTINPSPGPILNGISVTHETCTEADNGTATANVTGGTGNITYIWSSGQSGTGVTSVSNLDAGPYTVTIIDANICTVLGSFTINPGTGPCCTLDFITSVTHTSCNYLNGAIDINVISGSGSYSYNWSHGATSQDAPNLPAGDYSVTITDNTQGCQLDTMVTINPSPGPILNGISVTHETCTGAHDGTASANVSGGTGSLTYIWSSGQSGTGLSSVNNLAPGPYNVTVIDANICTVLGSFTINSAGTSCCVPDTTFGYATSCNPADTGVVVQIFTNSQGCDSTHTTTTGLAPLNLWIEGDSGFCKSSVVPLTAHISPGSNSPAYLWKKDGAAAPGVNNDSMYNAFQVGAYTVEVTDLDGCTAVSAAKNIVVFQLPTVTISGSGVFCTADSAAWTAVATPGSGPIVSYQWKRDGFPVGPNSPFYTPSQDGNYSVEVTDINGCKVEETKRLLEIPAPQVVITGDNDICPGGSLLLTANAAAGPGATISSHQWKLNGSNVSGVNATYLATQQGNYTVDVTSSNGCITESPIKTIDAMPVDSCDTDSCVAQNIVINSGWNMISSYIIPQVPGILDIINNIASNIIIIKNGQGQAAIPSLGINVIGDWTVEAGYKLKSSNPDILTIGCEQVDPTTTPISLPFGWSLISYLRATPMDAVTAFNGIASNALIIKNVSGASYIPSFGINTIGNLEPGEGYSVKMAGPDVLYYPANLKTSSLNSYVKPQEPVHYQVQKNTGHNATIIIPAESIRGLETGDEIAVFNTQGMLSGAAVYEGNHLAIAAWGDDPTTSDLDGFNRADDFIYRIWRSQEQIEFTADVVYESGDLTYQDDGVSILKKLELKQPLMEEFALRVFPNPTKGTLHIEYYLPDKDAIQLSLLDVCGKELVRQTTTLHEKGKHTVILDLSSFASGLYICNFRSANLNRTIKVQKF